MFHAPVDIFMYDTKHSGSEPARDSGGTFNTDVDCCTAIASRLTPTGDLRRSGVALTTAPLNDLQLDPGRLQFGVLVERMQRFIATVARLFEATKRRSHVAAVVLVDPHATGTQSLGGQVSRGDVRGPHRCGEAIWRVVGNRDGFFGGVESDDRQHRTKNLFLSDFH